MVKNYTIEEIRSYSKANIGQMSEEQLKDYINSSLKVTNQKLRRLNKSNWYSGAQNKLDNTLEQLGSRSLHDKNALFTNSGTISKKQLDNLTKGQLRTMANAIGSFNKKRADEVADTSTVRGAKKHQQQLASRLTTETGGYNSWSKTSQKNFWKVYNRAINDKNHWASTYDSHQTQKILASLVYNNRIKSSEIDYLVERLDQYLIEQEKGYDMQSFIDETFKSLSK